MEISFQSGLPGEIETEPLRLLVVADLGSPAAQTDTLSCAEDLTHQLAGRAPELFFEVPNLLGSTPARLEVRLALRALRDFTPSGLCDQLPLLGRVRDLLAELQQVSSGKRSADQLDQLRGRYADLDRLHDALALCTAAGAAGVDPVAAKPMSAASRPAAPGGARPTNAPQPAGDERDQAVNRILDLVGIPEEQQKASVAVDALVGHISRNRVSSKRASSAVDRAIETIAARFGEQLDAVMHHEHFLRLESTWRGLRFLVDHCDFRANVQLQLCHAQPAELIDVLQQRLDLASDQPPDLIVAAGYLFDTPETQTERIQQLGELAERSQIAALFGVAPAFFGQTDAASAEMGLPATLLEQTRYTKWNSLRRKPCSRWLAAATNRFLLRAPYEPETSRGLPYHETVERDADHLWGDPVWAVAARVAASFKATGWPTLILGREGRVEGLPIRSIETPPSRAVRIPLEGLFSEQLVADLARCGFIALGCRRNSDAALLVRAPTLFRSDGEQSARRSDVALPYQLFLTRVVHAIDRFREKSPTSSVERLREGLERHLYALIATTGPGAYVEVEATEGPDAGAVAVHLDLRAGQFMLNGARIELDFRIHH